MLNTIVQMKINAKAPLYSSQHRYKKQKRIPVFPQRLYDMLEQAEERGYDHIISWMPDGKSFKIHLNGIRDAKSEQTIVKVLKSNNFQQTKFRSFLRQLNQYDFVRIHKGPRKGECRHDLFVRGRRDLLDDKSIEDFQKPRRGEDEDEDDEYDQDEVLGIDLEGDVNTPGSSCFDRLLRMSTRDHNSLFLQRDQLNYWKPSCANLPNCMNGNACHQDVITNRQLYWKPCEIPTTLMSLNRDVAVASGNGKQHDCNNCNVGGEAFRPATQTKQCDRDNHDTTAAGWNDDDTIPTINSDEEDFDDWMGSDLEALLRPAKIYSIAETRV
jgi:hypothetical protein